jgi:16S rRNA pseudouridine516 synthase
MRLDKFVCKSTELTKKEAIQRINFGELIVNDVITTNEATQVHQNNTIMLNGVRLKARDFRYIMMHKPTGTICSNIDEVYPSLFNYLDVDKVSELHIAGRLDADTTGLVLITDDGHWSFNITLPDKKCSKVYRVNLCNYPERGAFDHYGRQVSSGKAYVCCRKQLCGCTSSRENWRYLS